MKGRARVPAIHTVRMASIVSWFSNVHLATLAVSGHGDEERAGPPHATNVSLPPTHRAKVFNERERERDGCFDPCLSNGRAVVSFSGQTPQLGCPGRARQFPQRSRSSC